jgi:hypothetical protein
LAKQRQQKTNKTNDLGQNFFIEELRRQVGPEQGGRHEDHAGDLA